MTGSKHHLTHSLTLVSGIPPDSIRTHASSAAGQQWSAKLLRGSAFQVSQTPDMTLPTQFINIHKWAVWWPSSEDAVLRIKRWQVQILFPALCSSQSECGGISVQSFGWIKKKISKHISLVSWCFEPSQPQRITSGLNTNFTLSPSYSFHRSSYHKSCLFFEPIYIPRALTQEPASGRVTHFILRAYTGTMC